MSIKAIDVKPLKNYELEITFENGKNKEIRCETIYTI